MSRLFLPRALCVLTLLPLLPPAQTARATEPAALAPASGDSAAGESALFGVPTSHMIGLLLLEQGRVPEALPYLEYAWRALPGERVFANDYVSALAALGRDEEAIAVLTAAVDAAPTDPAPRRRLAALLADEQRFAEALLVVADVRRLGTDDAALLPLEGEILAGAGRGEEAVARFREARTRLPEQAEALTLRLGQLLAQQERQEELLALWTDALATWPESRPVRMNALRDLIRAGRARPALAVAATGDSLQAFATGLDRLEGFSWTIETVRLLVQGGQVGEAIGGLEARRRAGLLDRDGTVWLGRLLLYAERWTDALALLREAAANWPDDGRAHLYLGEALAARGDAAGAEAQVRQAGVLDPEDPDAMLALIRLLTLRAPALVAGSPGRAELAQLAARAEPRVPAGDARGRMILGYAYRALRDPALAAPQFEAAAAVAGVRREALLRLAVCLEDLRRYDEARSTLETLRQEFPDDPTIANSLGYFLAERGEELPRAEKLVRDALARQPENPFYIDSLGWVAFRRGDFDAAFDLLVQASNAAPDQPEILEHLALTLQALGRIEEAARVLRQALAAGADRERIDARLRTLAGPGGQP